MSFDASSLRSLTDSDLEFAASAVEAECAERAAGRAITEAATKPSFPTAKYRELRDGGASLVDIAKELKVSVSR